MLMALTSHGGRCSRAHGINSARDAGAHTRWMAAPRCGAHGAASRSTPSRPAGSRPSMTDNRNNTGGPSGPPPSEDLARAFADLEEAFTDAAKHDNLARLVSSQYQLAKCAGLAFHDYVRTLPKYGLFRLELEALGFDFTADRCPYTHACNLWEVACHMLAKTYPALPNDPEDEPRKQAEKQAWWECCMEDHEAPSRYIPPRLLGRNDEIGILQFCLECYAAVAGVCREIVGSSTPPRQRDWLHVKAVAHTAEVTRKTVYTWREKGLVIEKGWVEPESLFTIRPELRSMDFTDPDCHPDDEEKEEVDHFEVGHD